MKKDFLNLISQFIADDKVDQARSLSAIFLRTYPGSDSLIEGLFKSVTNTNKESKIDTNMKVWKPSKDSEKKLVPQPKKVVEAVVDNNATATKEYNVNNLTKADFETLDEEGFDALFDKVDDLKILAKNKDIDIKGLTKRADISMVVYSTLKSEVN